MKKLLIIAASLAPLLVGSFAFADNQQRSATREPVSIQLYWHESSGYPDDVSSYSVPTGKTLVIETVSASLIGGYSNYSGTDLPHGQLLLSLDGAAFYFIPLRLSGYCDETGLDCGDTLRPFFVGSENVRLYVTQEVVGRTFPGQGGRIIYVLLSGYLLSESADTLSP